ncbi:MAG TPA: GIY-YIG nuclease family protein [Ignavibacteria bacterium]
MYFTYILKSLSTGKLYIGQTNNLEDRVKRHNSNQNKFTKNKGPWDLVFFREFSTRSESVKFETKLKALKNTNYILENLNLL